MADLERVQSLNGKLKLQCPKCEMSLFGYQVNISDFTVTRTKVSKGIIMMFHSKCPSVNPGRLFFLHWLRGKVSGLPQKDLEATL